MIAFAVPPTSLSDFIAKLVFLFSTAFEHITLSTCLTSFHTTLQHPLSILLPQTFPDNSYPADRSKSYVPNNFLSCWILSLMNRAALHISSNGIELSKSWHLTGLTFKIISAFSQREFIVGKCRGFAVSLEKFWW